MIAWGSVRQDGGSKPRSRPPAFGRQLTHHARRFFWLAGLNILLAPLNSIAAPWKSLTPTERLVSLDCGRCGRTVQQLFTDELKTTFRDEEWIADTTPAWEALLAPESCWIAGSRTDVGAVYGYVLYAPDRRFPVVVPQNRDNTIAWPAEWLNAAEWLKSRSAFGAHQLKEFSYTVEHENEKGRGVIETFKRLATPRGRLQFEYRISTGREALAIVVQTLSPRPLTEAQIDSLVSGIALLYTQVGPAQLMSDKGATDCTPPIKVNPTPHSIRQALALSAAAVTPNQTLRSLLRTHGLQVEVLGIRAKKGSSVIRYGLRNNNFPAFRPELTFPERTAQQPFSKWRKERNRALSNTVRVVGAQHF